MWTRFTRLFVIKTKFEAFAVIYALGLGATERGVHYLQQYHGGVGGWLLFAVCPIAVFMVAPVILQSVENRQGD